MKALTTIDHHNPLWEGVLRHKPLATGGAIYFASFLLPAVGDNIPTWHALPGYYCAWFSLVYPWGRDSWSLLPSTAQYLSLLASGWMNPAFLAATALQRYRDSSVLALAFKFITIALIPSCWLFFCYQRMHPREGHILWIVGMLLVLFNAPSLTLRSSRDA